MTSALPSLTTGLRGSGSDLRPSQKQCERDSQQQGPTEDVKGFRERDDRGLLLHLSGKLPERLQARIRLVARLREEAGGGRCHMILSDQGIRAHRIADHRVVKCVAPVDVHAEQRKAYGATEVTCHVVETRGI